MDAKVRLRRFKILTKTVLKFGHDIFTCFKMASPLKLGCLFFSHFMNWNWRPVKISWPDILLHKQANRVKHFGSECTNNFALKLTLFEGVWVYKPRVVCTVIDVIWKNTNNFFKFHESHKNNTRFINRNTFTKLRKNWIYKMVQKPTLSTVLHNKTKLGIH